MKFFQTITLLIALAGPLHSNGSPIAKNDPQYKFDISVSNLDRDASSSRDEVRLTLYEFFSHFGLIVNSQFVKMPLGTGDRQDWKPQMPSKSGYLNINYRRSEKSQEFYRYTYVYLVNAQDSLHCEVFRDSVRFSGKGSDKMNIQAHLFRLKETKLDKHGSFDVFLKARTDIYLKQLDFLESKRGLFSSDEFDFLTDQCYGLRNWDVLAELRFRLRFRKNDTSFDTDKIMAWLSGQDLVSVKRHSLMAPYLMDYLYQKEKFMTEQMVKQEELPKKLLANFTDKFDKRTSYHLKMVMIAAFFNNRMDILDEFDKSTPLVEDKQYANIFKHFFSSLEKGTTAFEFTLPDINGKIHQLKDFKGKVIVIDFWFTGCIPCLELAKQMKTISEELDGSQVVFITANVDPKEHYWRASVRSGNYTHAKSIDLFLGGMKSDMVKHYNVNSYPRLIVIGKHGTIIDPAPKIPKDPTSREYLVSLIKMGLK